MTAHFARRREEYCTIRRRSNEGSEGSSGATSQLLQDAEAEFEASGERVAKMWFPHEGTCEMEDDRDRSDYKFHQRWSCVLCKCKKIINKHLNQFSVCKTYAYRS